MPKEISAVIHLGSDFGDVAGDSKEWAFELMDYSGKHQRIHMEPGDILWYEGRR